MTKEEEVLRELLGRIATVTEGDNDPLDELYMIRALIYKRLSTIEEND